MCTHSCLLYTFSSWGYSTAAQFLSTRGSSPGATRSMRTSGRSSPSRRPCGAQLLRDFVYVLCFRILCIRHFVINEINNIRIHFIISFYVICAVIYCSFCCIYMWLDPGMYMIARFMSFYKPGVTPWKKIRQKIQDTTGIIFIKGPKHSFLSLGGPRHGARVWCLGWVPKHRN